MHATSLAPGVLVLWRALRERGLDADAIARSAGVDPDVLADPNERIPDAAAIEFWRRAVAATGDPCFGLDVARHVHPTSLHALGYAWLASATLGDALRRLQRYFRVVTVVEKLVLHEEEDRVRVELAMPDGKPYSIPADYDAIMATLVALCRMSAGEGFRPISVRLAHAAPACAERYEPFFRAPVTFSAGEYSVTISRASLDEPLPTANAELALSSERIVQSYLSRLDRHDVVANARRVIVERLASGTPSQAEAAQALNMSARTLQRRLAEHGLTFKALLETIRRELATEYLRDSRRTVNEIAYLVGFSELSNFSRAFRRWTGRAPSAYRDAVTG